MTIQLVTEINPFKRALNCKCTGSPAINKHKKQKIISSES